MANKKNYYYVLVFTDNCPVYVTDVKYGPKVAYWNKDEKPLELSKGNAEDLVFGLTCNFFNCVVVMSRYELEHQPYDYEHFECTFVKKESEGK